MAEETKRKNLGRGLDALFDEEPGDAGAAGPAPSAAGPGVQSVPIEYIRAGNYQPRHRMDVREIDDLANSIRELGILQPILVRSDRERKGGYEIIAGERRWRAAQRAQLHEVPVIVRNFSDVEALEVALVENLQREDLSPLEEAEGYDRLMREFEHTQENLAKILGKSRSHVANMIRLLNLPDPVKQMMDAGDLTAGHARALLNAADPVKTAKAVIRRGLNVRQTERLVQRGKSPKRASRTPSAKDSDTIALEHDVSQLLGLKVGITFSDPGGTVTIHYESLEQLDDILHRLTDGARGKIAPAASDAEDEELDEELLPATAEDAIAALEIGAANDDGDSDSPTSELADLDLAFELTEREIDDLANPEEN